MLFLNAGWAIYRNTPPPIPPITHCYATSPRSGSATTKLHVASSHADRWRDYSEHPAMSSITVTYSTPAPAAFLPTHPSDFSVNEIWLAEAECDSLMGSKKKKQMGRRESCTPTKKTAFLFFYQFLAFSNPLAIGCFYQKYRFLTKKQRIRASCEKKKRCQVKPRLWHKYISFLLKL